MYAISNELSPTFMVEMMNEIDIPYNTRSSCQVKVDIDGNITDFTKKSNYLCDKAKTSRYVSKSMAGTQNVGFDS